MPSKKIFAVAIVSFSIIFSIWITRDRDTESDAVIAVEGGREIINTNSDWQNILVGVSNNDSSIISVVPDVEDIANDPSLTARISKDFMSQYLLTIQKQGFITDADIQRITQNTLQDSEAANPSQPKYSKLNIKTTNKNDKNSVIVYRDTVNRLLRESSSQIKEDPVDIVMSVMETEDPSEMPKIDFMVITAQKLVKDLLMVEVPSTAVENHLRVVNVFGSILSSLEAMKESVSDPIRSFIGISNYQNTVNTELLPALDSLNQYFIQRTGSAI